MFIQTIIMHCKIFIDIKKIWNILRVISGVRKKKVRGVKRYGRPIGGCPVADPPRGRRIFEKLQKDFLRNVQKIDYFSQFF